MVSLAISPAYTCNVLYVITRVKSHDYTCKLSSYRAQYRFMEHKRMYSKGMEDRVNFVESGYTTKAGFKLERGNVLENRKIEHAEITLQESLNDAEKLFFKLFGT